MRYKPNQEWIPRPIPPRDDSQSADYNGEAYEEMFPSEADPYEDVDDISEQEQFVFPERAAAQYNEPPVKPRKKKHGLLRFLLKTALCR